MAKRPATAAPSERPLTVTQLASRIADAVVAGFQGKITVVGEVSGFRDRTHWYFDLKDAGAVVSCVTFAAAARKVGFTPANGQEVIVTGRIEFYQKSGKVTLLVERIEPVGAGAQDLALRALIEELRTLGWLDEGRKKKLPVFPRRVAVVTSRTGAALQDVLDTMRRRCPAVSVALVDARVQGDGAAAAVAGALRWLSLHHQRLSIDAVLVTRGGGSKEDLAAFNDRNVAQAIVECAVPVVAAIGHETDTTVAELVADLRCATPTQAAMRLTPDRLALGEQVDAVATRLRTLLARDVREHRRHVESVGRSLRQSTDGRARTGAAVLERLARRLEAQRPAAVQARRGAALHSVEVRLTAAMRARLEEPDLAGLWRRLVRAGDVAADRGAYRLESLDKRLGSVGPSSVLGRGYSYTMRGDGTLIRTVADARPGDSLKTTVSDGIIGSTVDSASPAPPPPPASPRRRRTQPRDQMDLFGGSR
jgi:exodeoxyribonuclease VII large subunit